MAKALNDIESEIGRTLETLDRLDEFAQSATPDNRMLAHNL